MVPKIIKNHEWISLVLNKRRLTVSFSGIKASGGIPDYVFEKWHKALIARDVETLKSIGVSKDSKVLDIIEAFSKNINTIWPEWNTGVELPKAGETVKVNMGKRRGIVSADVVSVIGKGNYVTCNFPGEKSAIAIHVDMIVK